MRLQQHHSAGTAIISTILFPFLAAASGNLDCERVVTDGVHWNLSKLGGPKSVLHSVADGASLKNTTYTIDLCRPLKRVSSDKIALDHQCPGGTRVCAIERMISQDDGADIFVNAIPIAGELKEKGGDHIDSKWTRLKTSDSSTDSEKEGLRLTINGGFRKDADSGKTKSQKANIEFLCDKDLEGDENLWNPEDQYDDKFKRQEAGNSSLTFLKYDQSNADVDVLHLQWSTKYACESSKQEEDAKKSEHWGFFTWFILIAFMLTATYLIFGSWLNYTRYGARGWDLLPHGDTIRDVPYLLKDLSRKVLNTIQGGGSRGGYAAV